MSRTWGYWTRGKLDVLRQYLDAFTTASKSTSERIYIDAFAGDPENVDRLTGNEIEGSARIALSIDNPPFTHIRLFETEPKAKKLESVLRADFPSRDLKVYSGNCNIRIPEALEELKRINRAPTFAFVDPNGKEAEWRTLEALANFRPSRLTKAELFLLFAIPMFTRLLKVNGDQVRPQDSAAITAMFGSDDWQHIYNARLEEIIKPRQARIEYLNLMRWRLETVLGYNWTHPLEVRNEFGNIIYYMIFATDHETGDRIIKHLYTKAATEFPAMRQAVRRLRKQKKDKERGVMLLFDDEDLQELRAPIKPGEQFYEHEPPEKPWFMGNSVSQ